MTFNTSCNCGLVRDAYGDAVEHERTEDCDDIAAQRFYAHKPAGISNAAWEAGIKEQGEI